MLALRLLSEGVEGPNTELLWLMYLGIAFFFVVIIFGWLSSSRKQGQHEGGDEAGESGKKKKKAADNLAKIEEPEGTKPEQKSARKKK